MLTLDVDSPKTELKKESRYPEFPILLLSCVYTHVCVKLHNKSKNNKEERGFKVVIFSSYLCAFNSSAPPVPGFSLLLYSFCSQVKHVGHLVQILPQGRRINHLQLPWGLPPFYGSSSPDILGLPNCHQKPVQPVSPIYGRMSIQQASPGKGAGTGTCDLSQGGKSTHPTQEGTLESQGGSLIAGKSRELKSGALLSRLVLLWTSKEPMMSSVYFQNLHGLFKALGS